MNPQKILALFPGVIAGLCMAGCASVAERELHAGHNDTRRTIYEAPDTTDAGQQFDGNATLDDYLGYAFSHNPTVRSAFNRWKAALERIPQARALDDPTLSFDYFINQMDTRYQASLTQMFPAPGTLDLRGRQAVAEAEAAMHAFETARLMLFDRVVKTFHEYHYLSRAISVTDENHQLLADLEQVVTTRYKAGLAPFSNLVGTQLEKDRIANELDTLRDERAPRSAGLAALLNLPVYDVLPWPKATPSAATAVDVGILDGMLDDLNPELKEAASMIAAETWRKELAHKSFLPGFMLGAGWMVMPGMDGQGDRSDASILAGITIPVWRGRYRAELEEAGSMIEAATNERDGMRNRLKAELSMAVFKLHDAERRIRLSTESLVPKATQSLEVAKQEFSAGKLDFMTLINAQRSLLEFRLMLERAAADREIALGEIGCCIGKYSVGP